MSGTDIVAGQQWVADSFPHPPLVIGGRAEMRRDKEHEVWRARCGEARSRLAPAASSNNNTEGLGGEDSWILFSVDQQ